MLSEKGKIMRYRNSKRIRVRRGAAATEMAVLLPFLGLMFAAAVDFGRVYFVTQILEDCARAGALYASGTAQTSSATGPSAAATTAACASGKSLSPPLQDQNVTVNIDSSAGTATVTITYAFQPVTPVFGTGGTITLQRSVLVNVAPLPGT
jgi:Flp pilus assembly protein TadG